MKRRQLNIVQLYPEQMNLYGDYGNAQIICRRAELYGYQAKLISYNSAPDMANLVKADLILGGGGQDSGQRAILSDLAKLKSELPGMIEAGVPMLVICGLYQLMGHYFQTGDGDRLTGLGIFDAITVAGRKRLIGNAVVDAGDELGVLVGYENHSGRTDLGKEQASLGRVIKGWGNDGAGKLEGAIKQAAIGTYLHGPVLAKSPRLADWLLAGASRRRYGEAKLEPADGHAEKELARLERLSERARQIALTRPQ